MKYIEKGDWPDWLTESYKKSVTEHKTPSEAFEMLSYEQKQELREILAGEQGFECCYCMTKLDELDKDHVVIEHQFPRNPVGSEDRHQGLDYNNLFLSCNGISGKGIYTCDKSKGNKVFKKLDLTDKKVMDTIYFKESNGTVHSEDTEVEEDIVDILNLNDPYSSLYKRRFYGLATLEDALVQVDDEEDRLELALDYYAMYSDPEFLIDFKEMYLYILQEKLKDIL